MTLRPRDRIALGVVLVLGLIGAFYKLALSPERQKAATLESQIATARQHLTTAQQSYTTGRQAQASLTADVAEWNAIHIAVPTQPDVPALLRTLQNTAKAVHVNMTAITLGATAGAAATGATAAAPTTSATTTGATSTGATTTSTAPAATPVPVQLSFSGGYTALNNLVRRLTGLVAMSDGKLHATGPLLSVGTVNLVRSTSLTVQLTASIYEAPASTTSATSTGGQ
jgi:hypothetical protein